MLSATFSPGTRERLATTSSSSTSSTSSTPAKPAASSWQAPSIFPANCPTGTSQGSGLVCPEGHVKSGFTSKGVCCKPAYRTVAPGPAQGVCPPGSIVHRYRSTGTASSAKCLSPATARRACPFPSVPLIKKQDGNSVFYACASQGEIPSKIAAFVGDRWRVATLQKTPTPRPGLDGWGFYGDYQETPSQPARPSDAAEVLPEDFTATVDPAPVQAADPNALLVPPGLQPEQSSSPKWLKPVLIGGGVLAAIGIAVAIVRR